MDYFEPGEQLTLDIIREKEREQLTVTLGERTGPRFLGRGQEWPDRYREKPPFFFDPDWWREMETFMERWQKQWEENSGKVAEHRAL